MNTQSFSGAAGSETETRLEQLRKFILDAAELLPRQGPITKFAFLNPLQGLEHEHYDDVMLKVGDLYGNEAYLDDDRYREELGRGRILAEDLKEVLAEYLGSRANESVAGLTSRIDFRLAMLVHPLHFGQRRELDWVLAETDALQHFRPEVSDEARRKLIDENRKWMIHQAAPKARDSKSEPQQKALLMQENAPDSAWEASYLKTLWQIVRQKVQEHHALRVISPCDEETTPVRIARFRETTSDRRVDEVMIRFTAAYLDQGYAAKPLPNVNLGYWASFAELYTQTSVMGPRWHRVLAREIQQINAAGLSILQLIDQCLERLQVPAEHAADFLCSALLSLRGFAGMIWQTETRADLFQKSSPSGTLIEFLAVRLLLLALIKDEDRRLGVTHKARPAASYQRCVSPADSEQLSFMLFELAQVLGWRTQSLAELKPAQWIDLCAELHSFNDHQRRKCFHAALERRIAKMALQAIGVRAAAPAVRPENPKVQIVFCIDAREESLRRHLEELDPDVETFGIAGFFGVPMYYRGLGDAGFSALCPIVMKPSHWITEEAVFSFEESNRTRARARHLVGTAQRRFQTESRTSIGGALVSTLVGPLATIPMLSRILLPRLTARMNRTAKQFIAPPAVTRLHLERSPEFTPAPPCRFPADETKIDRGLADDEIDDRGLGFTLNEMIQMSERSLRDIGLTSNFAPLVMLLGHGSECLNNPHESAYHCGACAGNAGGPNARALAAMLNDVRVRQGIAANGLVIPDSTFFIGGQHNTATEEIMFFDLELLPPTKISQIRQATRLLAEAGRRNAHERCRRFESASLDITPEGALFHVQNRAEDLAQTRPEYGNGTNAICFVGRRHRIRGLYLDRRSFMMSYDASQDTKEHAILARILGAVIPVCQGINALYTLSAIDSMGWGSGTKLPHNVTSLIGVMEGAASDLRTGLPWQGVDIHEPVRLLFIIETTPQAILSLMAGNPTIDRILRNHWAHIATVDPQTGELHRYTKDRFVPHSLDLAQSLQDLPTANGSRDWYRGRRDHLPFAITTPTEIASLKRSLRGATEQTS